MEGDVSFAPRSAPSRAALPLEIFQNTIEKLCSAHLFVSVGGAAGQKILQILKLKYFEVFLKFFKGFGALTSDPKTPKPKT